MNLPANAGVIRDVASVPGLGRIPQGGHTNLSSIIVWRITRIEEAWRVVLHGVTQSWT